VPVSIKTGELNMDTSKLSKIDRNFLANYFTNVGSIWEEYFDGKSTMKMFSMSQKEREKQLSVNRDRLHEILLKMK
jgi:hypothetical protein